MTTTGRVGAGFSPSGADQLETIRFPVVGMTCGSCVVRITRALKQVPGVDRVRVDLGHEVAFVRRRPATALDAVIASAIRDAGYEANLEEAELVDPRETAGPVARLLRRTA